MKVHNWWLHHEDLFSCIKFSSFNYICRNLTKLTQFIFVYREYAMHSATCHVLLDTKNMVGIAFELIWSDYVLRRTIRGHCAQQRKTRIQCDNAYFDGGYAHIVAISMSHAVWNICFICVMTVFLYVSNKQFAISPYLHFCVLKIWYLPLKTFSLHDNNDECMLLTDMQHSHPHITFYQDVVFLCWVGVIFFNECLYGPTWVDLWYFTYFGFIIKNKHTTIISVKFSTQ